MNENLDVFIYVTLNFLNLLSPLPLIKVGINNN